MTIKKRPNYRHGNRLGLPGVRDGEGAEVAGPEKVAQKILVMNVVYLSCVVTQIHICDRTAET